MVAAKLKGIHKYSKKLADGTCTYYYKVNREKGSPVFWRSKNKPEPEPVSDQFLDAYNNAKASLNVNGTLPKSFFSINDLITEFRRSGEWAKLARDTKRGYEEVFALISDEFGDDDIKIFEATDFFGDVLEWQYQWSDRPRKADRLVQGLTRLANFAKYMKKIDNHVLSGIKRLHRADRSDIIWTTEEIERFCADASPQLRWGLLLAKYTGLRRHDLVSIKTDADKGYKFDWHSHKSKRRNSNGSIAKQKRLAIPIHSEIRKILEEIAHYKGSRSIPVSTLTILCNENGRAWTKDGFSTSFNRHRDKHGIDKHLHDLRGNACTEFKLAGFSNDEIARILGWERERVEKLIELYVSDKEIAKSQKERYERATEREQIL
ncbi:Phage integrase family protein [Cohaesibacter sp. ES.047]|uniref:tyrosine-type recombinase/integrase n=1 Tax=Cohaesibacter sp. ES.047 TaxID=1798205 RepID=UPI000BB748D8|nr:tyrosine-type recombinase/integrase [Cohaesibacter sp. ES.047]SNY93486.1 Phage integrase family protein [Cohaesibacter sp. ES.047]